MVDEQLNAPGRFPEEVKTMKMKTKMPLYLLDFGMEFKVKSNVYTLVGTAATGMYEARDKFGLIVEFQPNIAVWI